MGGGFGVVLGRFLAAEGRTCLPMDTFGVFSKCCEADLIDRFLRKKLHRSKNRLQPSGIEWNKSVRPINRLSYILWGIMLVRSGNLPSILHFVRGRVSSHVQLAELNALRVSEEVTQHVTPSTTAVSSFATSARRRALAASTAPRILRLAPSIFA